MRKAAQTRKRRCVASQHGIASAPGSSNWPAAAHYSVKARIALQIHNRGTVPTMLAKLKSGRSIDEVIAWAADELEGFTR